MKYTRANVRTSYANFALPRFLTSATNKVLGVGGAVLSGINALSMPLMVGQMFIPDATTRKIDKMRRQDMEREAKGLPPLPTVEQTMAGNKIATQGLNPQTTSYGDVRITNPRSDRRLR